MANISKYGEKWRAQVAKNGVRKSAVWPIQREIGDQLDVIWTALSTGDLTQAQAML